VAERPVVLPPGRFRSTHLSDQPLHLFYRVLPNGKGWYCELVDSENEIVARGVSDERVGARADAFRAAFDRLQIDPEPRPTGAKWPYTFST
jgi:hypothetical protein